MIYEQETRSVEVKVRPIYNRQHSSPEEHLYIWEYEIQIVNKSEKIVQLLSRYWKVTNSYGEVEEVNGPGVIGLQPVIKPKEVFQYRSFTRLNTPEGSMVGTYTMKGEAGEYFDVVIPLFELHLPARLVKLH